MAYVGRQPLAGEVIVLDDIQSQFNGALTSFTLTRSIGGVATSFYPVTTAQLLVSLGGTIQEPDRGGTRGFKIDGNQIVFATAPPANTDCFIVSYGNVTDLVDYSELPGFKSTVENDNIYYVEDLSIIQTQTVGNQQSNTFFTLAPTVTVNNSVDFTVGDGESLSIEALAGGGGGGGSPYVLPTATTTTLGGVRVDGTTITISGGIISAAATNTDYNNLTNTPDISLLSRINDANRTTNDILAWDGSNWVDTATLTGLTLSNCAGTLGGTSGSSFSHHTHSYVNGTSTGLKILGAESVLDVVGQAAGDHSASVVLRGENSGFSITYNPNQSELRFDSFTATQTNFTTHDTGTTRLTLDHNSDLITGGTFSGDFKSDAYLLKGNTQTALGTDSTFRDVFVYDTSTDSDGGLWRKRTHHTSWYNESLNTSNRGGTREFPALAVIACTDDYVYIFDGTKEEMPMWMRFTVGSSGGTAFKIIAGGSGHVSAKGVTMKNGLLAVALDQDSGGGAGGVPTASFIDDIGINYRYAASGFTGSKFKGDISQRDTALGVEPDFLGDYMGLNNDGDALSIDSTVLRGADINPSTGLPYVTLAIGHTNSVSVIEKAGITPRQNLRHPRIVDLNAQISTLYDVQRIRIDEKGEVRYIQRSGVTGRGVYLIHSKLRSANTSTADVALNTLGAGSGTSAPYLPCGGINDLDVMDDETIISGLTESSEAFFSRVSFPYRDPEKRIIGVTSGYSAPSQLVATITNSYNTGWQVGKNQRTYLASTDTTDASVSARNLITNSTFDSDVNNWTGATNGVLTNPSNRLRLTNSGGINGRAQSNTFSTTVGKQYGIKVDYHSRSANGQFRVEIRQSGHDLVPGANTSSTGSQTFTFTSEGTGQYMLELYCLGSDGEHVEYDNVYVYELEQDRSYRKSGLQIYGTVPKQLCATGGEIVSYGPFSTSNYLKNPYSSQLDFVNGNFSIMFWVKRDGSPDEHQTIVSRTNREFDISILNSSYGNKIRVYSTTEGGTMQSSDSETAMTTDLWQHVCVNYLGGRHIHIYIDGRLDAVRQKDYDIDSASADFYVGVRDTSGTLAHAATACKLSLLRISNDCPTPEQIQKIYSEEWKLFREDIKATIYGSGTNGNALAVDPELKTIYVGTSAGRSDFNGLCRINNTTDGISQVLSAAKGLIAGE